MESLKQSSGVSPEHFKIISGTGYGPEVGSMSPDVSVDFGESTTGEDPFVAEARKAAENTRKRDDDRKTDAPRKKSRSGAAPPPPKKRKLIETEPEIDSIPPVVIPKRKRIIE